MAAAHEPRMPRRKPQHPPVEEKFVLAVDKGRRFGRQLPNGRVVAGRKGILRNDPRTAARHDLRHSQIVRDI